MSQMIYKRGGDTLVFRALDRLAGSEVMAIEIVHDLIGQGVSIKSLTEPALSIDTSSPMGQAIVGIMAVFAREYGLSEQEERVMVMLAEGRSTDEIAGGMGCKNATIRTYVHRLCKKTGTSGRRELMAALEARAAGKGKTARMTGRA